MLLKPFCKTLTIRKMKILKYSTCLLFVCSLAQTAFAQLPTGEVEVVKSFDARLADTERIDLNPALPPVDTSVQRQVYRIPTKTVPVDYPPPRIRPLSVQQERLQEAYNGYLKAGVGFPRSFLGEGAYTAFLQDQFDFGAFINHHSANNTNNIENQRFSFTEGKLKGTVFSDQGFAVSGHAGYTADNVYFYGYNFDNNDTSDTLRTPESVQQKFSTFDVGAEIFNGTRTAGDFNYRAGIDMYFTSDDYATRERGVDLTIMGEKWIQEKHPFQVVLNTDFTNYEDTATQTLNNFFLQPSFTYHADVFQVKAGVNIASHNDEFFFFPDLEASANILGSALTGFIGTEGSLSKNTFRSLTDYNPFLTSRIRIENTNYFYYYGGARGNVQGINYRAEVGYKTAENLALFLTDPDDINRFDVLYDDVDIFSVSGTVTADVAGLNITGVVTQNFFTPAEQEKPWHLPSLEMNLTAQYAALDDKLRVQGEIFIENGVPFINNDGETDNLNGLFDVSLGAEYMFTEQFGGFLNIYNLANNKRQRWYRYPTFGLNALLGLTAKF